MTMFEIIIIAICSYFILNILLIGIVSIDYIWIETNRKLSKKARIAMITDIAKLFLVGLPAILFFLMLEFSEYITRKLRSTKWFRII